LLSAVDSPTSDGSRGKPATRRTLLARRDGLTVEERVEASAAIAERAAEVLARFEAGAVIALYAAKGSEAETALIDVAARGRGLEVVYPRVVERDKVLAFHAVTRDELVVSRFALREPRAEMKRVGLEQIAAFFVPGVAFDRAGGRIGWGHGHYDATLAAARADALRVGVGFECQVVERVPHEAHDALLNIIITEVATHVVA
jgi:5-formyltetrahydrofolate cyclo-ligase